MKLHSVFQKYKVLFHITLNLIQAFQKLVAYYTLGKDNGPKSKKKNYLSN